MQYAPLDNNALKRTRRKVGVDVRSIKAKGPRPYMEDYTCIGEVGKDKLLIGVFDGHGGEDVAKMCSTRTIPIMKTLLQSIPDVAVCLRQLYAKLDEESKELSNGMGCTAVIVVMSDDRIWFSNCGDAMAAIKVKNDAPCFMTQDHKVETLAETERIQKAGGLITYLGGCARVYGTLNIARSIGDHFLKTYVISEPYISSLSISKAYVDWIVIASDGLWDVYSPAALMEDMESFSYDLTKLVRQTYLKGSMDNVSIVLTQFKPSDGSSTVQTNEVNLTGPFLPR